MRLIVMSTVLALGFAACARPIQPLAGCPTPFAAKQFMGTLMDDDATLQASLALVRGRPREEWLPFVEAAYELHLGRQDWYRAADIASTFGLGPEKFTTALDNAQDNDDWESAVMIACGLRAPHKVQRATLRNLFTHPKVPQARAMHRALIENCPFTLAEKERMLLIAIDQHMEPLVLRLLADRQLPRKLVVATVKRMFISRQVPQLEAPHHLYCVHEMHCRQAVEAAVTAKLSMADLRGMIDRLSCADDTRLEPATSYPDTTVFRHVFDTAMAAGNFKIALLVIHAARLSPAEKTDFIEKALRHGRVHEFSALAAYRVHQPLLKEFLILAETHGKFRTAAILANDEAVTRRMFNRALTAGQFAEAAEISAIAAGDWRKNGPLQAYAAAVRADDTSTAEHLRRSYNLRRADTDRVIKAHRRELRRAGH